MGSPVALFQPLLVLTLYLVDIGFVVACTVVHFSKQGSTSTYGIITVVIFFLAGYVTNWFNFYRYELSRMSQRSPLRKVMKCVFLFIPSQAFFAWTIRWLRDPSSWSADYWVATLRLFYATAGSLTQAVFQTFLIVHLWYNQGTDPVLFDVMIGASAYLAFYSVLGVCTFVWKEHYEEEHENPAFRDFVVIVVSVSLNMCGRIVSMAMVAAVIEWYWMVAALGSSVLFNYALCLYSSPREATVNNQKPSAGRRAVRCLFPIPIATLYALSVSKEKVATVVTTLIWLGMSVPQIVNHHDTAVRWMAWGIPFSAQVLALMLMLWKWKIFKIAFTRFERIRGIGIGGGTQNRQYV